jgi:hypothetical protein
MRFFLKFRSLELFLLLIAPIILSVVITETGKYILPVLNSIFFLLFFSWIYSTGNILGKHWKMHMNYYYLLLFRLSIVMVVISSIVFSFLGITKRTNIYDISKPMPLVFLIIVLIAIFYCFYYVSKILRSVELNRNVDFEQHQKEFFLFFVFVIGIWVLQPRIRKLLNKLEAG